MPSVDFHEKDIPLWSKLMSVLDQKKQEITVSRRVYSLSSQILLGVNMAISILQTNLLTAKKGPIIASCCHGQNMTKLIQKSTFSLSILAPTFPEPDFIKALRGYSFSEENHKILVF